MNLTTFLFFNGILFFSKLAVSGIYEPHVKWNKEKVSVCFVDNKAQISETKFKGKVNLIEAKYIQKWRDLVSKSTNENYSYSKTGIQFIGWKPCSETPNADSFIILSKLKGFLMFSSGRTGAGGQATIGEDGVVEQDGKKFSYYHKGKYKPYVYLFIGNKKIQKHNQVSLESMKAKVVHEFGHLAGLRHEHTHIEDGLLGDKNCQKYTKNVFNRFPEEMEKRWEELGESSIIHTSYDPKSIMNYCGMRREDFAEGVSNLSEKDMITLRHMYQ